MPTAILSKPSTQLVDDPTATAFLGLAPGTLNVWRATKRHPLPYVKIGRRVMYRMSDLEAFIESRLVSLETGE